MTVRVDEARCERESAAVETSITAARRQIPDVDDAVAGDANGGSPRGSAGAIEQRDVLDERGRPRERRIALRSGRAAACAEEQYRGNRRAHAKRMNGDCNIS